MGVFFSWSAVFFLCCCVAAVGFVLVRASWQMWLMNRLLLLLQLLLLFVFSPTPFSGYAHVSMLQLREISDKLLRSKVGASLAQAAALILQADAVGDILAWTERCHCYF